MTDFSNIENNLRSRGYAVSSFETRQQARDYLLSALGKGSVGIGGSQTIDSLNIFDELSKTNAVFWHWKQDQSARKDAASADIYLTSVNAAAETGELVNIDGTGNRVAASVFGHKKVFFIFGKNKIEPTLEKAIERARNVASPLNAKRLGKCTPCVKGDERCYDCKSKERICRAMCIYFGPMMGMESEIIIIDENLGM